MKRTVGLAILIFFVIMALMAAVLVEVSESTAPDLFVTRVELVDGEYWIFYSDGSVKIEKIGGNDLTPVDPQETSADVLPETAMPNPDPDPSPETESEPETE